MNFDNWRHPKEGREGYAFGKKFGAQVSFGQTAAYQPALYRLAVWTCPYNPSNEENLDPIMWPWMHRPERAAWIEGLQCALGYYPTLQFTVPSC